MVKKHKQSRSVFTYAFRARKRQAISRDNMCRNRPIFRIQFFICDNINKGVGLVFWIISFTSNRYWIAFNAGLLQFLLSEMLSCWVPIPVQYSNGWYMQLKLPTPCPAVPQDYVTVLIIVCVCGYIASLISGICLIEDGIRFVDAGIRSFDVCFWNCILFAIL